MADWYDQGYELVCKQAATSAGVTLKQAKHIYDFLSNSGLIDYDIEKEVFFDLCGDDNEDE